MATSNFPLLVLAFSLLAVSAAARPCKTLFFITSTSYYHIPISQNPNPNPNVFLLNNPSISPRSLTFFFTTTSFLSDGPKFGFKRPSVFFRRSDPMMIRPGPVEEAENFENRRSSMLIRRSDPVFIDPTRLEEAENVENRRSSMIPVEFYSSVTSSIRDRTKDIMSVVCALLFGVGCGAITAATMYLIWSLFWPNRFDFEDSDDDFDAGDDDVSPKKMGYVAIPSKVVDDDDLKKPAAVPAKEVV